MNDIQIIDTNVVENYIRIDPMPGSSIQHVVAQAIELAAAKNKAVAFTFNGVVVKVTASSKVGEVVEAWRADMERDRQNYLSSDAYKEQQAQAAIRLAETQKQIDALLIQMPGLKGHAQWVNWVAQFAPLNDNMHLKYPKHEIIERMCAAGYVRSECVEHPDISTDYGVAVRWVMGQALDHLLRGMPIHPGMAHYAEQLVTRQIGGGVHAIEN